MTPDVTQKRGGGRDRCLEEKATQPRDGRHGALDRWKREGGEAKDPCIYDLPSRDDAAGDAPQVYRAKSRGIARNVPPPPAHLLRGQSVPHGKFHKDAPHEVGGQIVDGKQTVTREVLQYTALTSQA